MGREFIIHRYCSAQRPFVSGRRPFIVRGPRFDSWTDRPVDWYHDPTLRTDVFASLRRAYPVGRFTVDDGLLLAELLLREAIITAVWVTDRPTSLPLGLRPPVSVDQAMREVIHSWDGREISDFDLASELGYCLCCVDGIDRVREYLSEDQLTIEALDPSTFVGLADIRSPIVA